MKLDASDPQALEAAAARLAAGELLAFPTETVYGLGARADDAAAVAKIFAAKGRPPSHPLIVHVADIAAAQRFAGRWPALAQRLAERLWPGPVSLIVPRAKGVAEAAAGGAPTIGLRCPSHPAAQALLRAAAALGVAGVAAPSANRFGAVSPTSAAHVQAEFGEAIAVLDGGACPLGIESAIVDCSREELGPVLLRPGTLGRDALAAAAGAALVERDAAAPRAPGTLDAHYAPRATLRLMDGDALRAALAVLVDAARQAGGGTPKRAPTLAVYSRAALPKAAGLMHSRMPDDAAAAAHELFATLRRFDAQGATLIWVEQPPDDPAWDGVRDRLQRAATR